MCEILVVFEIENELQRQEFINKIKTLGGWARVLSNAYIVKSSSKTAITIRDNLRVNIKIRTDYLLLILRIQIGRQKIYQLRLING